MLENLVINSSGKARVKQSPEDSVAARFADHLSTVFLSEPVEIAFLKCTVHQKKACLKSVKIINVIR